MIGVTEKLKIEIREQFMIPQRDLANAFNILKNEFDEVVIISTCNRTEIYLHMNNIDNRVIDKIFRILNWDLGLREYVAERKEEEAVRHIMEVACGFHSKILGEDQILGQVRSAFEMAMKGGVKSGPLHRLFQYAIACGKEFKSRTNLNEVPVSSSSIAVKIAKERNIKKFMLIGFGEVGELALKYIDTGDGCFSYIVVRSINEKFKPGSNYRFVDFAERKKYYKEVDCIIACTSAPHHVVHKEDLPEKPLLIFDLAVPRDVHKDVDSKEDVEVIGVDEIDTIDSKNRAKREQILFDNRYILEKYVEDYTCWAETRIICKDIKYIKEFGDRIYKKRYDTYTRKKMDEHDDKLVQMLLKSTATAFVNRAIEILKEENRKGSGEECMKILERIFCDQE